jgi:DNA-binding transcriptional MocR family regulator
VLVHALDSFATVSPAQNGLVLGYGMIEAARIDEAVHRIARAL